jgi:hypothetical protein
VTIADPVDARSVVILLLNFQIRCNQDQRYQESRIEAATIDALQKKRILCSRAFVRIQPETFRRQTDHGTRNRTGLFLDETSSRNI